MQTGANRPQNTDLKQTGPALKFWIDYKYIVSYYCFLKYSLKCTWGTTRPFKGFFNRIGARMNKNECLDCMIRNSTRVSKWMFPMRFRYEISRMSKDCL